LTGITERNESSLEEATPMPLQPDGYTFALSGDVSRTPVHYKNRYGIEIAADLYRPKNLDESATHPAIVVARPTVA
jgi:hypothetical protein